MENQEFKSAKRRIDHNFYKILFLILRITQLIFVICEIATIEASKTCGKFFTQSFISTCITAAVLIVTLLLSLFCKIQNCLSQYLITMFVIDVIFTFIFAHSSLFVTFSIRNCEKFRFEKISASIFTILEFLCFYISSSADLCWFRSVYEPYQD
ncbi:uncharacterized protein LOC111641540 isoform X2 [Centruroides sculpturatus]|uniref:uncharacterized protein LOC111641540 isoform X2 n=1 Tax=Centruroides sculpturatus TaxID=218467 RepID=UPI000C6CB6F5|nr:uncharacterized protein LOC111641540 isoform X2 [Centruroides sculpturatus]